MITEVGMAPRPDRLWPHIAWMIVIGPRVSMGQPEFFHEIVDKCCGDISLGMLAIIFPTRGKFCHIKFEQEIK